MFRVLLVFSNQCLGDAMFFVFASGLRIGTVTGSGG